MNCPNCHADNPASAVFCNQCGTRLSAAVVRVPPLSEADIDRFKPYLTPAQIDALSPASIWRESDTNSTLDHLRKVLDAVITYLPRHLIRLEVDQLSAAPKLFGGEFLHGTLLYADISGFTAMSERLSTLGREGAEQVTEIINRYFGAMLHIILARGGDLFKFGGDALLVYFPRSLEALEVARDMQHAMSDFTQVKTTIGTFPLQMKIGLNSGSIFTARLGTETQRQFVVTGAAVNATSHAQSIASAEQIIITPEMYAALANDRSLFGFSSAAHGHVALESIHKPIDSATRSDVIRSIDLFPTNDIDALRSITRLIDRLIPYLPIGLLPRLISDPSQPKASSEHRLVGVLFANFVGATELIERSGPDQADRIAEEFNRYLVHMQAAISKYDGVINKIDLFDRGDKLLALFGAPISHEDDAERTVRAALKMQSSEKEAGALLISQRIGVNTGVVFAGEVGSSERREYTVMGDVVNLSARLMSAAADGEMLLSSAMRRKVSPFFEIADRGTVSVKGKSAPVPIYSVVGRRAQPEPVRGIRGLHSPLVGREKEAKLVRAAASNLRHTKGSIISLIGEAGLGKSRLIDELRSEVSSDQKNFIWLEGHCLSYTQSVSYSAFNEVVRSVLGVFETDTEVEVWSKLRRRIDDLFPHDQGEDVLPYLATFLSLPLSGALAERVEYLEGEALQRQIIRAVATLLERLAQRRPLILIFDDLHWADSASLALLERILTIPDRAPALISLIYRPDRSHGCWALGQLAARSYPHHYTEIMLRPLDVTSNEDDLLVSNLLDVPQLPIALAQLIGRAEGNPFYIEEIIRTLIDAGAIVRDANSNRWRIAGHITLESVPDSLQAIIMTRIDRLAEQARRTLQLASVVGRTFRYLVLNWLATAATLANQLDSSLASLQRAELVREQTRVPELEYGFAQAVFRDVAYESLLMRDRRVYHRLVGQQMEDQYAEHKREEVYELLAHHYSLSDDQIKSLHYLIKAGDKTRLAYANKESIDFYRQAEALVGELGSLDNMIAVAEGLGDVLYHVGEYDEALTHYQQAITHHTESIAQADLYRRIGAVYEKRGDYEGALNSTGNGIKLLTPDYTDTVEMARLLTLRCRVYHQQGQFDQAIEAGKQALEVIEDSSNYQEIAQTHNELGNAHEGVSQPDDAIDHFNHGLLILDRIGDEYSAAKVYNNLAVIYSQTDLARSAEYFRRALETMQRFGDTHGEAGAQQNLGVINYLRGDYPLAIEAYQHSLDMKERLGDNMGIADCHINLGEVYRAQNNLSQAIEHLEQALFIVRQIGANQSEAECQRQLAECYLENDEPEKALSILREALTRAQTISDLKEAGIIYRVMGNAYLHQHEIDAAVLHLGQSIKILMELNREFDVAATRYDFALALIEAQQIDRARQELREAVALFDKLDLPQERAKTQVTLERLG
jgi:class 3 adenylate cyclase/tetratricopeptide (TPR) repeat protein